MMMMITLLLMMMNSSLPLDTSFNHVHLKPTFLPRDAMLARY